MTVQRHPRDTSMGSSACAQQAQREAGRDCTESPGPPGAAHPTEEIPDCTNADEQAGFSLPSATPMDVTDREIEQGRERVRMYLAGCLTPVYAVIVLSSFLFVLLGRLTTEEYVAITAPIWMLIVRVFRFYFRDR